MKLDDINLFEMTSDEFLKDAEAATKYFEKEMEKIFPKKDYIRTCRMTSSLGPSIIYEFADRDWKVTIHNSSIHLTFMMHLTNGFGKIPDEMEKFSIGSLSGVTYQMKARGVKYRKITSKSPIDATKKLVDWFKKNKKGILEVQNG